MNNFAAAVSQIKNTGRLQTQNFVLDIDLKLGFIDAMLPIFCCNLSLRKLFMTSLFVMQQVRDQTNCGNFNYKIVIHPGLQAINKSKIKIRASNWIQNCVPVWVWQILFFWLQFQFRFKES